MTFHTQHPCQQAGEITFPFLKPLACSLLTMRERQDDFKDREVMGHTLAVCVVRWALWFSAGMWSLDDGRDDEGWHCSCVELGSVGGDNGPEKSSDGAEEHSQGDSVCSVEAHTSSSLGRAMVISGSGKDGNGDGIDPDEDAIIPGSWSIAATDLSTSTN